MLLINDFIFLRIKLHFLIYEENKRRRNLNITYIKHENNVTIKNKMSKNRNVSINLNKIDWSFKEVLKIANHINPNNWSLVESSDKIAFLEIKLPRTGPAVLQKQLILSNYLQVEVFIGSAKLGNEVLAVNNIASVADLWNTLEILRR